ncbi:MAG TPA: antitoxin Xre/MbcA/ParS toxin-binding domain-containing protein [Steroidobacteraceae bacterium]|jgi:putative toxin-antitoxin system antitoxin component (TIGR02293 family)|nr:antitoxin Xre/MbcA/ParS toxin-binding domain-containing protein [Steroidobacteraceae bacterium]
MSGPGSRDAGGTDRLRWNAVHESAGAYYRANPLDRIAIIRGRVPAAYVVALAQSMQIPKERLYSTLSLARATVDRKILKRQRLSQDESERVLAVAQLIGQVANMVRESGNPSGFDAAKWMARWLEHPHPALGGRRPGELLDTADGRNLVTQLLAQQQAGTYA